ncbi:MAG TPA: flippase-like domain-containing protein [Candidatus Limihabitans stercoravium]|nr:flippase-like domain-containing protein [Candidatus Limihabitans stercoravium]
MKENKDLQQPTSDKEESSRKKKSIDPSTVEILENVTVVEPKKKKYGWVGSVLLLALIAFGIYIMVQLAMTIGEGEIQSLDSIIQNANWTFVAIAVGMLLLAIVADSLKYAVITDTVIGKANLLTSTKVAMLGRYYDNITPFASGGQPMQIYYLHKKGYSAGQSTAIVFIKYFVNMLCWMFICILLMATQSGALNQYVTNEATRKLFLVAGWIGVAVNSAVPVMIILFVIFPRLTTKVVSACIWLLNKMRIVKDKEKTMNKARRAVDEFCLAFKIMSQNPWKFFLLICLCILEPLISMSLPYVVMVALGGTTDISWVTLLAVMTLNVYATMSVAIIPTPGNSGFAENAVLLAFANIASTVAFWVVFVWRFFTYYIYILIGMALTLFDVIRKAVRRRRKL